MSINKFTDKCVTLGKDFLNFFCHRFGFNVQLFETLGNSPVFKDGMLNSDLYEVVCKRDDTDFYVIKLKGTYKFFYVNSKTNKVFPEYGIDGVVSVNGKYEYTKNVYGKQYAFSYQPSPRMCLELYDDNGNIVRPFDGNVVLFRKQYFTPYQMYYVVNTQIGNDLKTMVYDDKKPELLFELDFEYMNFIVIGYLIENGQTYYMLQGHRKSLDRQQMVIFDGTKYYTYADETYHNLYDRMIKF